MGIYVHPVAPGKAYEGYTVVFCIGDRHTGWSSSAYQNRNAVADYLGHDLSGYPAA